MPEKPSDDPPALAGEEEAPGDLAIIGEGPDTAHAISMKTLQAVYNELTGKTEEIAKRWDKPFQASFGDLEQLNHKFTQVCEQYNIQSARTSVTVFHVDDTKEEFSSFDRFRIYNRSATSPVESVLLKFNFLIVLPKTRKPQNYVVSVRIASRIAAMRLLRRASRPMPRRFLMVLGGQTGIVTISYVDYMVARNLLSVAEGWFNTLASASLPAWANFIRQRSGAFRPLGEYSLAGLTLLLILRVLPVQVTASATPQEIVRFLVLAAASLFLAYRLGHFFGATVEDAVDDWEELGYLALNRGDETELSAARRDNKKAIIRAIGGGVVTLLLGFVASLAANVLSK